MASDPERGSGAPASLDEAADELYAGPRTTFIARRAALSRAARSSGDASLSREIAQLRKPSVAAAALNRLARDGADALRGVLDLTDRMRAAQRAGDGDALRRLVRARQETVQHAMAVAQQLSADADEPLSGATLAEVEHALRHAVIDARFAPLLRAGRVDGVPAPGSEVAAGADHEGADGDGSDDEGADAPQPGRRASDAARRERDADAARRRHAAAVEDLTAARRSLGAALETARTLDERLASARREVDVARERLRSLEQDAARAADDARAAQAALRRAEREALRAKTTEERVRPTD